MSVNPTEIKNVERINPNINIDLSLLTPEGRIKKKYEALGGEAVLDQPTSKEEKIWTFANGSCICDNPEAVEAFEIHGEIYKKWLSLGGMNFGIPCTDETSTPDNIGRYNHFNNNTCSIYWTPNTGAAAILNAIREKWASLGWENSYLGYPITDELSTPDKVGRYNHFSNGGSIYWTPTTGVAAIGSEIRKKWESLGWENSYLGYPIRDESDFAEGGRASEFQNGGIYWWSDTGAIDLRDVIVHYTGLYCFGETDESSDADEPYLILSTSTPQLVNTVNTQIYSDVDAGNSRPDVMEIYRGRPYGINIGVVLMEHDHGDPNQFKEEINNVVMGVHTAGTAALGLIPIAGPFIAAVAGPALGSLMPSISSAINDLFNFGDDRLGGINMTITAKQMILLAIKADMNNFWGIGYKLETELISGEGASYKAYFNILPA